MGENLDRFISWATSWIRKWWLSFATAAVYLGFWTAWPVATFLIACITLSGMVGFLYGVGKTLKENEVRLNELRDTLPPRVEM